MKGVNITDIDVNIISNKDMLGKFQSGFKAICSSPRRGGGGVGVGTTLNYTIHKKRQKCSVKQYNSV